MTACNPEAARHLYDLLCDEERRTAFVAALGREVSEAAGNDKYAAASAETMKARFAEEDDEDERPRRRRKKEVETTLEQAVADAFSDLSELGSECRDVVDNTPESLAQTDRIMTLNETADTLSSMEEQPDVPPELAGLPVKYLPLTKSRPSRQDRCDTALGIIVACIEALATVAESDPRHQAAVDLSDDLEGAQADAEGCNFPGMYG
jgi:hypothetical protein